VFDLKLKITLRSIEGITHPDPRGRVFPYLFIEENSKDLTLIDPSFLPQLPVLEEYILNAGYDIKKVKRIILTHLHIDHT
jgi:glyoxylase-like metal-dependent hydrolase (beta-lactamase superfamily II)